MKKVRPLELRDHILSFLGNEGMTFTDADERRGRLMEERRAADGNEDEDDKKFGRICSLCEH